MAFTGQQMHRDRIRGKGIDDQQIEAGPPLAGQGNTAIADDNAGVRRAIR
jgi:hypothetical protein